MATFTYRLSRWLIRTNLSWLTHLCNRAFANLKNAKVTRQQLKTCRALQGTILPDGKMYDGSFQLTGDIDDAKACGFDINNPVAMQKWFSMSYNEFMQIADLRKEKPELTDWGFPT